MTDTDTMVTTGPHCSTFDRPPPRGHGPDPSDLDRLAASLHHLALRCRKPAASPASDATECSASLFLYALHAARWTARRLPAADLPVLRSVTTSKETLCPSLSPCIPARSTALMCTKTSLPIWLDEAE